MMNATYITAAQLTKKLNELHEIINSATKEKEHIEYVLDNLLHKDKCHTAEQLQLFTAMSGSDVGGNSVQKESGRGEGKMRRRELLQSVCILLNECGKPMESKTLYLELKKIDPSLHKPTFDAYMSEWCKDRGPKIWRVYSGVYDLIENKPPPSKEKEK